MDGNDELLCSSIKDSKNYVFIFGRQVVYRCLTCELEDQPLIVCDVCSVKCHQGHYLLGGNYSYFQKCVCGTANGRQLLCKALMKSPLIKVNTDSSHSAFLIKDSDTYDRFKCPVCLNFMCGIINMCKNGHNICEDCATKVASCPVCRVTMMDTPARNLALESLGRSLEIPCENCHEIVRMHSLDHHNKLCLMSKCPVDLQCKWHGIVRDFSHHCHESHQHKVMIGAKHDFNHKYKSQIDCCKVNIIDLNGKLFLFHRKFQLLDVVFQSAVKHLSPLNENCALSYTLQFSAPSGDHSILFKTNVRPFSEDLVDIYKQRGGVTLNRNRATNIIRADSLNYTLTFDIPE